LLWHTETPLASASPGQRNCVYLVSLSANVFSQGIRMRISVLCGCVYQTWSAPAIWTKSLCVAAGSVV
jgi:hypothetical protein